MPNTTTVELPDMPLGLADPAGEGDLPLRGMTVLAVEDSRFASDALRLMCRRLGARLRRAESLQAAGAHLRLYRPDLVIVDLGLPDGRGEALIRDLAARRPRVAVLGMSGDPAGREMALAAGADGFMDKPLESLAAFRSMLRRHLPGLAVVTGGEDADPVPDALALRDDLAHAAALLDDGIAAEARDYVTGFLRGVARHAHDPALAEAAGSARPGELRALLQARLDAPVRAFDIGPA